MEGNVANYVETEQIVHVGETQHSVSYVQTRGSMPLFWRQIPNLKYTPELIIDDNSVAVGGAIVDIFPYSHLIFQLSLGRVIQAPFHGSDPSLW